MNFENLYYYRSRKNKHPGRLIESDVFTLGGTSAGIIAAVQLKRLGHSVVIAEFGLHLGGLSSGGLGATDIGNKQAIGGLSRRFYRDLGVHYGQDESWRFEPSEAESIFNRYTRKNDIPVYFEQHLASVKKEGNQIVQVAMEDGTIYRAKIFIDVSYEGDLMARAGVSFHTGRESNATYGETYNGVHFGHPHHNFTRFVDPYKISGVAQSGLCWGISGEDCPSRPTPHHWHA